jgi:hypothetical protein
MSAVASFDYSAWIARYPEFSTVDEPTATAYFTEATIYHANDGSGPVANASQQLLLLNMLTAHLAQIYSGANGQDPSPLVGRINTASEGTVSVGAELPGLPGSAAWYSTTKYGLAYWAATAPYRTMRYRPGPRRIFDPWTSRGY